MDDSIYKLSNVQYPHSCMDNVSWHQPTISSTSTGLNIGMQFDCRKVLRCNH